MQKLGDGSPPFCRRGGSCGRGWGRGFPGPGDGFFVGGGGGWRGWRGCRGRQPDGCPMTMMGGRWAPWMFPGGRGGGWGRWTDARSGGEDGELVELQDCGSEYRMVRWIGGRPAEGARVSLEAGFLVVRVEGGERRPGDDDDGVTAVWRAVCPDDVVEEAIHAEAAESLLTVVLPKSQPRVIPVSSTADGHANAVGNRDQQPQGSESMDEGQDASGGGGNGGREASRAFDDSGWTVEDLGGEYRVSRVVGDVAPEDVRIELRGVRVVVSIGRSSAPETFELPPDVDPDFILADVEGGRLTVALPKSQPRAIPVAVSSRSARASDVAGPDGSGPPSAQAGAVDVSEGDAMDVQRESPEDAVWVDVQADGKGEDGGDGSITTK